jgi:hypothetical protein
MRCSHCNHLWGQYEDYCHCSFGKCHNSDSCGIEADEAPTEGHRCLEAEPRRGDLKGGTIFTSMSEACLIS